MTKPERCMLCKDDGPSHGLERKGETLTTIAGIRLCAKHIARLIDIASENGVSMKDYLRIDAWRARHKQGYTQTLNSQRGKSANSAA